MTLAMWNWNTTTISMPTILEMIKLDRQIERKRKQKEKMKKFGHRSNHGLDFPSKAKKISLLFETKLMKFFEAIRKPREKKSR